MGDQRSGAAAKLLSLLGLAKKAGRLAIGETPVETVCGRKRARLLVLAEDAAENTRFRAARFAETGGCALSVLPVSKEELGRALGRGSCAMAALTDDGFAASVERRRAALARLSRCGPDGSPVPEPQVALDAAEPFGGDPPPAEHNQKKGSPAAKRKKHASRAERKREGGPPRAKNRREDASAATVQDCGGVAPRREQTYQGGGPRREPAFRGDAPRRERPHRGGGPRRDPAFRGDAPRRERPYRDSGPRKKTGSPGRDTPGGKAPARGRPCRTSPANFKAAEP